MNEHIQATPTDKPKKKWSQEVAMLRLTLIFIGGVVLFTLIPEEHPLRPLTMPLIIGILVWGIFKK